jgi:hypothetical protein
MSTLAFLSTKASAPLETLKSNFYLFASSSFCSSHLRFTALSGLFFYFVGVDFLPGELTALTFFNERQ